MNNTNTNPSQAITLPPVPKRMIRFRRTDGGYIYANNAVEAAQKFGGRLIQSCPHFGIVQLSTEKDRHGRPRQISITW